MERMPDAEELAHLMNIDFSSVIRATPENDVYSVASAGFYISRNSGSIFQ